MPSHRAGRPSRRDCPPARPGLCLPPAHPPTRVSSRPSRVPSQLLLALVSAGEQRGPTKLFSPVVCRLRLPWHRCQRYAANDSSILSRFFSAFPEKNCRASGPFRRCRGPRIVPPRQALCDRALASGGEGRVRRRCGQPRRAGGRGPGRIAHAMGRRFIGCAGPGEGPGKLPHLEQERRGPEGPHGRRRLRRAASAAGSRGMGGGAGRGRRESGRGLGGRGPRVLRCKCDHLCGMYVRAAGTLYGPDWLGDY